MSDHGLQLIIVDKEFFVYTGRCCLRMLLACLWFVLAGVLASAAHAKGTVAGTVIPNTATLDYVYDGKPVTVTTAPAVFTVAELIDVTLTWQDSSLISAKAGDTGKVLTFLVTNIGNGVETFNLSTNYAVTGDGFDPVATPAGALYIESSKQPGLQTTGPNADELVVAGGSSAALTLRADASQVVYVLGDIPVTTPDASLGNVMLSARSTTSGAAGAAPGTGLTGLGDGGSDAVVGVSRAQASATGGYILSDVVVKLEKSVAVADGVRVMSGAVLTYRITVTVSGAGSAKSLLVTDPVPTTTTYVAGSLTLNGVARTDASDSDNAAFSDGVVSVSLGDVSVPATQTIEFKATVN